ncbi:hypothetical protein Ocin01_05350 [Orchesella cincta]|uniref:Uncharacterized protein n=1 Tax=Orchesella cincta TaxID=48709 RepID=A0A1D2N8N6_ORCCI|nr:hypothetical protein Ocin01_05350 [Orchesella cincta]
MVGTKYFCAVAIAAACVFLQVEVAHSFFQFFQHGQDKALPEQQPGQVEPTTGNGNAGHHHQHHFQHHQQPMQNIMQAMQGGNHHHGMQGGFAGGLNFQPLKQVFSKFSASANTMNMVAPQRVLAYLPLTRKSFYDQCGTAVRHCEWANAAKVGKKFVTVEEDETTTPTMKQVCMISKHICIGNTETCVSTKDCDAAMKITEITREGTKHSVIGSVSHLNNCDMESQSVADASKKPQMLFGIGFATYDAEGAKIECRAPKASDFKLVFLWKNSTEAEGTCKPLQESEVWKSLKTYDHDIMHAARSWPTVCKSVGAEEKSFNLKNFLEKHTPTIHYTSFFTPPFEFTKNYEPQFSSNGMVISGTVA